MPQNTINLIFEYIWVPIVMSIAGIWHKLTGISTRTALLELAERHNNERREEDRALRDQQRKEILQRIDIHHKTVITKLEAVEVRVKNGR